MASWQLALRGVVEQQLHQVHIEPPAEFSADFFERSNLDKAKGPVEVTAGVAPLSDASQKRVEAIAARFGDNRRLERAADSSSAKRGLHIKRRLSRFVVRRSVGKAAQRGPAHDAVGDDGHQNGIPPAVNLEPVPPIGQRLRLDVERGRRRQDRLVVDLGNGFEIARFGGPDFDGFSRSSD